MLCSSDTRRYYEEAGLRTIELGPRSNLFVVARNLFESLRLVDEMPDVDEAYSEGFPEQGAGPCYNEQAEEGQRPHHSQGLILDPSPSGGGPC